MTSIASKVAKLRADRKWRLKELSAMTGISVSHLSAIEKGTRPNPSFQYIVKLSSAFQVPLEYFVESDTEPHERRETSQSDAERSAVRRDRILTTIERIYDDDTRAFIAAEQARPYITLARQLAQQGQVDDPSSILQLIAQFMRERNQSYDSP